MKGFLSSESIGSLLQFAGLRLVLGLFIAALFIFLSSCATQKRCLKKFPPSSDTIHVTILKDTIILRDTLIYIHIPGAVLIDSVKIPCPDIPSYVSDTVRAETPLARAMAWWKFPNIQLKLIQKDTTIQRRLDDAIREITHWKYEYEKIKQSQPVKYIPEMYKIAFWMLIGMVALVILFIIIRITKPI